MLQRRHAEYDTDEKGEGDEEPSGRCGNDAAWPPGIGCALDLLAEAAALSDACGSRPVAEPTAAADAASGGVVAGAAAAPAGAETDADAPPTRSASATDAAVLLLPPLLNSQLLRHRGNSMDGSDCGGDGGRKRCRSPSFLESGGGSGDGRGDCGKHFRGAEQQAGSREGAGGGDDRGNNMAVAIRADRGACSAGGESGEETAALTHHEVQQALGLTAEAAADSALATAAIGLGKEGDETGVLRLSCCHSDGYEARCGVALQLLQAALPGLVEMAGRAAAILAGSQGGGSEPFEGLPQVMERVQAAARCLAGEPLVGA